MTSTDKPNPIVPGDILAEKYRVDRVLGQGGMGVVVLAEHIELRERVAIKFLLDTPADNAELAERFLREARAAVRIKSEHVVRVIDVGRLPSGAPYMVMEYLEGQDLAERLLSGRVPIDDAVDYVIQCCEAMHVAHRSGIVHRDLKPANLFLTQRPDGSSLLKVLDFGISKVKSPEGQLSLTHTQTMMGSPLYMSPEQMRSSKDVSASADIWSLGVILHELIAGDIPFGGSTFPEVLVQVMSEEPPKLRSLRPEVPAGLEAVVLRCLEKDPGDRYPSVAALGVALTPYASARTLGLQERLRNSVSQPPRVAVAAGRLNDLTRKTGAGPIAIGAIGADAQSLDAESLEVVPSSHDPLPTRTNTAWGEQSAAGARAEGQRLRRHLALAGGALALVLGVGAFLLTRSSGQAPAGAALPAAPNGTATAAAPASASAVRAEPPPVTPSPRILPEPAVPTVAPIVEAVPSAPEPPVSDVERAPAPTVPEQHTPAVPPTATAPVATAAKATSRATARRASATPRTEKTARAHVAAAPKPAPSAAEAPKPPPPAAKASASARSKPLSIEFK